VTVGAGTKSIKNKDTKKNGSAKEVASILDLSTRTVEFHKYRMMQQLNIKTSAELVQYAVRHGIISL